MKKELTLLSSLMLFVLSSTFAQKINYESNLEKAKTLSLKQGKPLAILITIEPPVITPNFLKGLNDEKVIEKFNSNFINYKVDRKDTAASGPLIRAHNVYRFPSLLFFDAKGGLMYSDLAILSRPESLINTADKALVMSKEKSLVEYDKEFMSGVADRAFLKSYIGKRRNAGIIDNADLIERYVNFLSVQDLNNYAEVLFILQAGPLYDSVAYKLAYTNKKIVDSIYKTEPMAVRSALNNAIIANTMKSAIANKNVRRAYGVASFTRNTWTDDPLQGEKNWNLKILQYYRGVRDTMNYLRIAADYYERNYMQISPDSVRRRDSMSFESARIKAMNNSIAASAAQSRRVPQDSSLKISDGEISRTVRRDTVFRTVTFSVPKDAYATELNSAAWSFYLMAGDNSEYLSKAMFWSRRSLELAEKAAFYDTYAHLLYKLRFYSEAENMQKKAVATAKTERIDTTTFESEYTRIKNRTL
jgi:hypothetical protein